MEWREKVKLLAFLYDVFRASGRGEEGVIRSRVGEKVCVSAGRKEDGKVVRVTSIGDRVFSFPELVSLKRKLEEDLATLGSFLLLPSGLTYLIVTGDIEVGSGLLFAGATVTPLFGAGLFFSWLSWLMR